MTEFKIDNHPWPVDVRLDGELEHVEESGHIDSLDEYQRRTRDTAVYPAQGTFRGAIYATHRLRNASKVVEFTLRWGELMTNGNDDPECYPDELVLAVSKGLGNVLYWAARVADEFGLNLSDVVTENINRLAEGDNR